MKFELVEYQLADIVEKFIDYRGKTPKKTKSGIPLITAKIIKKGRINPYQEYIDETDYDSWMTRGIPKNGAVIITTEAPMGEVAQLKTNEKVAFAQRIIVVEGKEDIVDNTFLKYMFQSPLFQQRLREKESGTTVTGIKSKELKKILISIPSDISIQKKIAFILNSLDSKIELNNQMIATLEELAATLFKRWFVDFEFPDENGSPYKSSGGKMVDSELGEIPEGWEVNSIFDRCFITGGGTPKTNIFDYWDGKIPFYTPKDAKDFLFVNNTEKHVSLSGITNSSTRLYKSGTIFITARGTVGKINIAAKDMAMNQSCYAITSKNGNQYFIYNVLSRQVKLIKASSNGAVFNAITTRDFKLYKFSIPKKDELINLFEDRVNSFYEKCRNLILENDNLHEMRDSLLPKLLSGDILIK